MQFIIIQAINSLSPNTKQFPATFRDGFLMTISRNEDEELVVTLTISPNMTEEVGSEFFITYTNEEGKEGVEPNLELNVMGACWVDLNSFL